MAKSNERRESGIPISKSMSYNLLKSDKRRFGLYNHKVSHIFADPLTLPVPRGVCQYRRDSSGFDRYLQVFQVVIFFSRLTVFDLETNLFSFFFKEYFFSILNYSYYGKCQKSLRNRKILNWTTSLFSNIFSILKIREFCS